MFPEPILEQCRFSQFLTDSDAVGLLFPLWLDISRIDERS